MALIQDERGFASLIQMTGSGLKIADYPAIKRAIIEKYKEIYGSDIDITNTSADGVFVETLSLMIFNILQNVKFLYSNLDIRTASGKFLESLCALSGVYRNSATKSQAQLEITNNETFAIPITGDRDNLEFVDQSGLTWVTDISRNNPLTLEPGITTLVDVYCSEVGPVSAPSGWITQLITQGLNLTINQPNEATKGSYSETDSELRSRRNETISSQGLTVLSGLRGSLIDITGIDDCVIYNNTNEENYTSLDGTTIPIHSIYVVLRKKENVQISESKIGSTIYEKLTPGINTSKFNGQSNTGEGKEFDYVQKSYLGEGTDDIPVYWKESKGINEGLNIKISYRPGKYFSTADDNSINIMKDTIKEYLNSLSINETFTTYDLISTLNDEDPLFNNEKTYNIIDVQLNWSGSGTTPIIETTEIGSLKQYQTKDTYFNINNFNDIVKDDTQTIKYLTFTVKN